MQQSRFGPGRGAESEARTGAPFENVDASDFRNYIGKARERQFSESSQVEKTRQEHASQENSKILDESFAGLNIKEKGIPIREKDPFGDPVSEKGKVAVSSPASFDFDDDDLSDNDDEVESKVLFHKSEIERLISTLPIDKDLLQIHLVALLETYKIRELKYILYLATLYLQNGQPEVYMELLKDFKFDNSFGATENLTAYLLRAKAAYNLDDYPSAYKDSQRVLSLAKKYGKTADTDRYVNCASGIASICAARMNRKADELYYGSMHRDTMAAPAIFMGQEVTFISMEPKANPPVAIEPEPATQPSLRSITPPPYPESPRDETSLFRASTIGSASIHGHAYDEVDRTQTGPSEEMNMEFTEVFLEDSPILKTSHEALLVNNFGVRISRQQSPREEAAPYGQGTQALCLKFKSSKDVINAMAFAVSSSHEGLATRLVKYGYHYLHGQQYDVGFGNKIPHPRWFPGRYIDTIYNRFHLVSMLGCFPDTNGPPKAEINALYWSRRMIQDFMNASNLKITTSPNDPILPKLYESMTISALTGNYMVWRAIIKVRPSLPINPPPLAYSPGMPMNPFAIWVLWEGNGINNGYYRSMITATADPWQCNLPGMNLFHAAAKYSFSSTRGLRMLFEYHTCEICSKKTYDDDELGTDLTPYGVLVARANSANDSTPPQLMQELAKLFQKAKAQHLGKEMLVPVGFRL
ncbi:hypothetical protein ABW19_dt0205268 [Dactylella cylindrospora]|nr:hypothetical protein ABW19_dt0205268 [Dactylella cylindrospora]